MLGIILKDKNYFKERGNIYGNRWILQLEVFRERAKEN